MAFLVDKKNPISSHFRSHSQKAEEALSLSRSGFHVESGAREKALLAEDPVINQFKSYKKSVYKLKRVGDVLMIVAVAGCCYEIYVRATLREEARRKARGSA